MADEFERTRVLITVMTYPHPSVKHDELICTAGVTDNSEWVRLYPIDYRYRPRNQQFRKYQWIEVELGPRGHKNDGRRESRKPHLDSINIVGERLSSDRMWEARRRIIDELPHHTVNQLRSAYDDDRTSLGIVRPTRVLDLVIESAEPEWKPKWRNLSQQLRLFGDPPKPLKKIPYKFSYVFECEDADKPHQAEITDWELGVLYLKEEDRLGSSEAAAASVKKKFFDEICRDNKDTRFFMGTVLPYNTWIVLGTFWPPRITERQGELF